MRRRRDFWGDVEAVAYPGLALQVPAELEELRALYVKRAPRRVLEIGVWYGGTLRVWLEHAAEDPVVVAVDKHHPASEQYEQWAEIGRARLVTVTGDSRSHHVLKQVGEFAPYDWVFIDGDHSLRAVRADVANTLPLVASGGLLLLHDTRHPDGGWYPPGVVWRELGATHRTWEIREEGLHAHPGGERASRWGGIGVVEVT